MKKKIVTKNSAFVLSELSNAVRKGKDVNLIKINKLSNVLRHLEKNVNEDALKEILLDFYFNNEKKIRQIRNRNLDKKVAVKDQKVRNKVLKNRIAKKRNATPVYTQKYADSVLNALRMKIASAKTALTKAQADVKSAEVGYANADRDYNSCLGKLFCRASSKIHKYRSARGSWADTISKRKIVVGTAQSEYDRYYADLQSKLKQNKEHEEIQKREWEENRRRAEEKRLQEEHEAKLRAEGLELQNIKMLIAKQAEEIAKLEAETKRTEEEANKIIEETKKTAAEAKKVAVEEKAVVKASEKGLFGTTVIKTGNDNEVTEKTDNKNVIIMGSVAGLAVITTLIVLITNNNK